jgi:hypothetical protein
MGADNYHIVSDWRIRGTIDEVYEILPVYSADSTSSRSNEECPFYGVTPIRLLRYYMFPQARALCSNLVDWN